MIAASPTVLLSRAREILIQAGYTDLGEMNVPGRVGFRQPGYGRAEGAKGGPGKWGEMRRNAYICLEGSLGLRFVSNRLFSLNSTVKPEVAS